jgi:DNA-binding IclR family transcriptional regulator
MRDDPRPWNGRELADRLDIKPRNMLTQLAEWTRLGFLARTSAGAYALTTRRDTGGP